MPLARFLSLLINSAVFLGVFESIVGSHRRDFMIKHCLQGQLAFLTSIDPDAGFDNSMSPEKNKIEPITNDGLSLFGS
jgi:hypothetical protein